MDDFTVRGERRDRGAVRGHHRGCWFRGLREHPLDPEAHAGDDEPTLRPSSFDEFVGQEALKQNLKIFVRRPSSAVRPSTTYCSTVLPG